MLSLPNLRRITGLTLIANILSWYEFTLYLQFAPMLAKVFFPTADHVASLVNIYLIFALGFFARPFGTLLLGHLGDLQGRKRALLFSIALMSFPTLVIGLIPSYTDIGLLAPLLIAGMRIIQGFATGGEYIGAMCYLYEISPKTHRSFFGSLTFFGSQIGTLLSIVEFLFLKSHLPAQDFALWGWRLSFIFGGLIGVVSWLIRKHLRESPAFETLKSEGKLSHKPVHESLKEHRSAVIKAFWLSSLTLAGWYVSFAFTPIYLSQILKIDPSSQMYITAAMLALSTIFMPLFGYLADRSFRRSLLIFSSWAVLLLSYPLYYTIDRDPFALFVVLEITMTILLSIQFALLPTLLCDLFPIRIRYSGVGIGYNFCNVLFAGIAPLVALTLTHQPGFHMTPAYILMLAALLFLWSFLGLRKDLSHHEV